MRNKKGGKAGAVKTARVGDAKAIDVVKPARGRADGAKVVKTQQRQQKRHRRVLMTVMVSVAVILAVVLVGGIVYKEVIWKNRGSMPQLELILAEAPLEQVNSMGKDVKYEGNELTLANGWNTVTFEDVRIKGRGNSTWVFYKKPYQIKLAEKTEFLGLKKARKFILLANYLDDSYLRNDIAFRVARALGMEYALRGEFAELRADDNYYGLYYVTNAIEISKTGVDLRDPLGIIVELDNLYYGAENYKAKDGNRFTVKDVVSEDEKMVAVEDFLRSYDSLTVAAKAGDYARVRELADVESFAKYYLLSEFTENPDAYSSSYFMYKDGSGDVIHAGPGWDFDYALGNRKWVELGDEVYSPVELLILKRRAEGGEFYNSASGETIVSDPDNRISRLMFDLLEIPEFEELVKRIWNECMAGRKDELAGYIERRVEYIREAAARDGERWKKWDFDEEVAYLTDWVKRRYEYLDAVFSNVGERTELKEVMNFPSGGE